jgi:hypothetical protein
MALTRLSGIGGEGKWGDCILKLIKSQRENRTYMKINSNPESLQNPQHSNTISFTISYSKIYNAAK